MMTLPPDALRGSYPPLVTPFRENVTSHMSHGMLDKFSALATVPLYLATKLVYGPTRKTRIARVLPYVLYATLGPQVYGQAMRFWSSNRCQLSSMWLSSRSYV